MVKNVKRKGNAFENSMARLFNDWTGYQWKKTILSGGSWEKGDITPAYKRIPWVIELKNTEGWDYKDLWTGKGLIWKWWAKLQTELGDTSHPLLIMKKNRSPSLVAMDLYYFDENQARDYTYIQYSKGLVVVLLSEFMKVNDGSTFFD